MYSRPHKEPLARYSPLGLNATEYTESLWTNNSIVSDSSQKKAAETIPPPVPRQRIDGPADLHVPQLDGGVEGGTGHDQRLVRVPAARSRGAPLDRVDLLRVLAETVHALVLVQAPDLGRVVI